IRLVRRPARAADERHWDPESPSTDLLDGVDTLVHLAGASIAGRFTDRHLDRVRDSRVGPTRRLAELVAARGGRTALVCASAVGVYGPDRGDEELDEHSDPGTGPLAEIVRDWEAACEPARGAGARVAPDRAGGLLSGAGGMLPALGVATRAVVGGRLGSGRQWLAWVAPEELTDTSLRAVTVDALAGTVTAVAPHAVR